MFETKAAERKTAACCRDSYHWWGPNRCGTVYTEVEKSSPPAHTRVLEADTCSAQNNLSSAETVGNRAACWEFRHAKKLYKYICLFTCTLRDSIAWRTWARFFMILTSLGVESAHWPFWMGLMKRFRNSCSEPSRFFLMKLTMWWSERRRGIKHKNMHSCF